MTDERHAAPAASVGRGKILALGTLATGALLTVAATLALTVGTSTAAGPPRVAVYFVQGEQLAPVTRPGRTALDAVRQLVAGPTRAERGGGFRTYIPAATRVRSVSVANGTATVDLTRPFAAVAGPDNMLARLSELVRTLTGVQGTRRVQLLVNGAQTAGMFPGISTSNPITLRFLETPNVPVPEPPEERLPAPDPAVKVAQQRLIVLGYLLAGDDDGRFGPATQNAILAFQKWERLDRTGLLDSRTKSRFTTATRPSPLTQGGAGKRAEILLDRQVALMISNDEVVRTIAVSSGKPSTPTPPGDYRVYAKIRRWWSVPFREWLPYALPFVGGIAFHEFGDVPAFPASHGCVRQSTTVAPWTYDFADVGMPVKVIATS
jgi:peptidoglycan hydrolase-like protein with peptidoglycan-binding domain